VIYSSDLFTYNAKYFQTLPWEKWWYFAKSLRSMLKFVHNVAWQCSECMKLLGNLTIWRAVVDWCLTGTFLQLLLGQYSVRFGYQREQNYSEISLNQRFSIRFEARAPSGRKNHFCTPLCIDFCIIRDVCTEKCAPKKFLLAPAVCAML